MKNCKYAVIMAGGSGERFWPLSTPDAPKQFVRIFGGKSLIRQALERVLPLVPVENVLVVTAKALASKTRAELPELPSANLLLEPCRKNTAPAIATALGEILRRAGTDAQVAVLTADHLMTRPAVFRTRLRQSLAIAAKRDVIVTLGIKPTYAATGFGYIDAKRRVFVEKPDAETATKYFKSGKYVWNAGMFIFRAGTLQTLLAKLEPDLADLARRVAQAKSAAAVLPRLYPKLASISFDYAVMERTRAIEVVSGDFGWDDVGSYAALASHLPLDAAGNVRLGRTRQLECANCALIGSGARVSAFGLNDVVVATSGDEVLVMPKSRAAELKRLLAL